MGNVDDGIFTPKEPSFKAWKNARGVAADFLRQLELALSLCDEAEPEIERLADKVRDKGRLLEATRTMNRMVRAWCSAPEDRRPPVSEASVHLALAAVSYLVSPDDAIPDSVPYLGFKDDIVVLDYAHHSLSADLARFREWEGRQG